MHYFVNNVWTNLCIHKLLTKLLIIMNELLITIQKIVESYLQILLIAYECTNFSMAINRMFISG